MRLNCGNRLIVATISTLHGDGKIPENEDIHIVTKTESIFAPFSRDGVRVAGFIERPA